MAGGLGLAVHRVGGDDRVGDVHPFKQVPQRGISLLFAAVASWREDGSGALVERGDQVRRAAVAAGAAHRLAVDRAWPAGRRSVRP